jgi:Arc/MetJ-type ribon-helix-helix transcriptional regulator
MNSHAKTRNYRSVSINDQLIKHVKQLIDKLRTYHSVSEFVSEAVRLRIETLEEQQKNGEPATGAKR